MSEIYSLGIDGGRFSSLIKETMPDSGEGMFVSLFESVIDQVKQADADKQQADYLLATGQLDNPAEIAIASTKAELSVELLVQLRNKSLDAYSELMRMNL